MNIEQFIKTSTKEEIITKIIELKTNPQTEDVRLLIQKLQQQLNDWRKNDWGDSIWITLGRNEKGSNG